MIHIFSFRYELPSALEAVAIPTEEELEKERARREEDQVRFNLVSSCANNAS